MTILFGVGTSAETNNSASVTSGAITTQSSGSLFIAVNSAQGTIGISDNKSNTWVVGGAQNFSGTNGITKLWYVQNATGGAGNTFSGSQTGGAGPLIMVGEWKGCALTGGPHASSVTELSASGSNSVVGPSVTTTLPGCLIVTVMVGAIFTGPVTPTSANGTVVESLTLNGINVGGAMSWYVSGAAGSYNDTLTFPGMSFYDFAVYTFAFAPGGGGNNAGYIYSPGPGIQPAPSTTQFRSSPRARLVNKVLVYQGSGGLVFGGSATSQTFANVPVSPSQVYNTGPGIRPFSPAQFWPSTRSNFALNQRIVVAQGGLSFGSTSAVDTVRTKTGAGGISFGGTGVSARHTVRSTAGGIVFGGTAATAFNQGGGQLFNYTMVGGMTFGGSVTMSSLNVQVLRYTMSGGLNTGGTAAQLSKVVYVSSGGIVFSGTAGMLGIHPGAGGSSSHQNRRFFIPIHRGH